MKRIIAAMVILVGLGGAAPAPELKLWRLDCGNMRIKDFGAFADDYRYEGQPRERVASCYLVKHGAEYLLWDTGFGADMVGKPPSEDGFGVTVRRTIAAQLQQIGVRPDQVRFVGVSHYHGDHTGQAKEFPRATLLIGAGDWAAVSAPSPQGIDAAPFAPWLTGGGKVEPVAKDRDVFGDGSVRMLAMPGHTPGHTALLVRLPKTGHVLLTGDLWHAAESYENDVVPQFNTDRAATLASFDRFKDIAKTLNARVVIQHEPADVAKLPAFPQAAD